MTTDPELLHRFAQTNSEDAFAELVRRHVNLVYSAALRQVNGDEHLAKDVAQTVFTDLARKAASLASRENLSGWLYTSAHFAAAKIIRTETRRRDREEKFMREPTNDSGMGVPPVHPAPETGSENEWNTIRPALDAAMHELRDADREALLLRYFENRPFAEVGTKLGLNENAARMRVERALEKLRAIFAKRRIATAATLSAAISANAVQLAPAGLAATLTTTSLLTVGTGTLTLAKIITTMKLKLIFSALLVAGAATALVVQHQTQNQLRDANATLQQQIAQLQTDNASFSNRLASVGDDKKLTDDQFNELLKLRGEVGVLRRQAGEVKKAQTEIDVANQKAQTAEQNLATAMSAKAQFEAHETRTVNAMKVLGLAMRLYAVDHTNQYPNNLVQLTNELAGSFGVPANTFKITGIDLFAFDFMNVGAISDEHPNMIELRERIARQAPDGIWNRVYGLADGSVQEATSLDGNFDAWEKANTYTQPNQ